MTVKINLRPLREQRGLTQEALGSDLGVGQAYIGNIESGLRNPSLVMALKMARYFGVPLDDIVVADDEGGAPEPEAACA